MGALTACQAWAQIHVDFSTEDRTWGSAVFGNAMDGVYRRRNHDATQGFRAVQCSESGELTGSNGKFAVGAGCGDLKWRFTLLPYPVEGAVASRQSSWFSSVHSWWLVSEGTAMLHPPGEGQSRRISLLVDGKPLEIHAGPRLLPELHHAPGFWLLGKPAFIDKGKVRHFFDRGAVPQHFVALLDSHRAGMAYLQAELPRAEVPPVFWMGLTDWQSAAGDGQAYSQLYMGAAFWTAIDSAMIKQGSLLPVLPEILARGFTPDGMPRRNELAELTGLTAETLNRVLDPFFGTE